MDGAAASNIPKNVFVAVTVADLDTSTSSVLWSSFSPSGGRVPPCHKGFPCSEDTFSGIYRGFIWQVLPYKPEGEGGRVSTQHWEGTIKTSAIITPITSSPADPSRNLSSFYHFYEASRYLRTNCDESEAVRHRKDSQH